MNAIVGIAANRRTPRPPRLVTRPEKWVCGQGHHLFRRRMGLARFERRPPTHETSRIAGGLAPRVPPDILLRFKTALAVVCYYGTSPSRLLLLFEKSLRTLRLGGCSSFYRADLAHAVKRSLSDESAPSQLDSNRPTTERSCERLPCIRAANNCRAVTSLVEQPRQSGPQLWRRYSVATAMQHRAV